MHISPMSILYPLRPITMANRRGYCQQAPLTLVNCLNNVINYELPLLYLSYIPTHISLFHSDVYVLVT